MTPAGPPGRARRSPADTGSCRAGVGGPRYMLGQLPGAWVPAAGAVVDAPGAVVEAEGVVVDVLDDVAA